MAGTPQYSLARLASAIQCHDLEGAERYLDIDRIAEAAVAVVLADLEARRRPDPGSLLGGTGQEFARAVMRERAKREATQRLRAELRRLVERGNPDRGPLPLPGGTVAVFRSVTVTREGGEVWTTFTGADHRVTRFRMSRQPDRSWKITALDPEWVRERMHERQRP
jgi:hypothetical protein